MKRFLVLAIIFALGACTPVAPEKLAEIKTIGVMSLVGDDVFLSHPGGFLRDDETVSEPSWGIDRFIADKIKAQLSGRYTVTEVSFDKAAFGPGKISHPLSSEGRPMAEVMRAEVSPQGLDAYLVVTQGSIQISPGAMYMGVAGLGISRLGLLSDYYAYAAYNISAYDGKTFAPIGRSISLAKDRDLLHVDQRPFELVPHELIFKDYAELTDEQKRGIEAHLKKLLDESLPETLKFLGFAP